MILTDDEIKAIDPDGLAEGFARAIESAVLDECNRVAKVAIEWNQGSTSWTRTAYKCIEVIKK